MTTCGRASSSAAGCRSSPSPWVGDALTMRDCMLLESCGDRRGEHRDGGEAELDDGMTGPSASRRPQGRRRTPTSCAGRTSACAWPGWMPGSGLLELVLALVGPRGGSITLEHVAGRGLLDVEDLAADRQQRLELAVARQLGGAQRRVALDDEELGALDVAGAAVGQLGRQRGGLQGVLAALVVTLLTGLDPGAARRWRPCPAAAWPGPSRRAWPRSGSA